MATTYVDNADHLEAFRTPLKSKNQDFTPAIGKSTSKFGGKNLFVTPTKRLLSATPRSALGNKTNLITPSQKQGFKRPKLSESVKKLSRKTKLDISSALSPIKGFKVYEDVTQKGAKPTAQDFEPVERCPWSLKEEVPSETLPPPLQLINDFVFVEPKSRPRLVLSKLEPIPVQKIEIIPRDPLPELPEIEEDVEICPWDDSSPYNEKSVSCLPDVSLTNSEISQCARLSREGFSQFSLSLLEDSIKDLENNLPDLGLPDIPSTPELERELSELLEISFDLSCP